MEKWLAGIEAGGTKFNCIIAKNPQHILVEQRVLTTTPEETIPLVCDFSKINPSNQGYKLKESGSASLALWISTLAPPPSDG